MKVTVWTTQSCVQCEQTKKQMTKLGIRYDEMALENHPERLEDFKQKGFLQAPIIQAGDSTWTGFRIDKIKGLANKLFGENK
jgi:glutaredoxin-like protein NrdH